MTKRGRHPALSPGRRILEGRSLTLPKLLIGSYSDLEELANHLNDLVKQLPKLKFIGASFVSDYIAKQYIILKYDLYCDTLEHLKGWMNGGQEHKDREYWQEIKFIGYQFR